MLQQECILYINITPALTNCYNHNTANQTFLFLFKKMYCKDNKTEDFIHEILLFTQSLLSFIIWMAMFLSFTIINCIQGKVILCCII